MTERPGPEDAPRSDPAEREAQDEQRRVDAGLARRAGT